MAEAPLLIPEGRGFARVYFVLVYTSAVRHFSLTQSPPVPGGTGRAGVML